MTDIVEEKKRSVTVLAPIDWGIAFALSHKKLLLTLALPAFFIELVGASIMFSKSLAAQDQFLIAIFTVAGKSWLSTAVGMSAIETMRGEQPKVISVAWKALRFLPKVFFCYVVVMMFTGFFALVPPGMLFVAFLIWAPMFCIAETFSKDPQPQLNGEAHDDEDFYEKALKKSEDRAKFFTGKMPWELGVIRSIRFASQNLVVSFKLCLLLLFGFVVPGAVVNFLLGSGVDFAAHAVQLAVSYGIDVLVIGVWAGAFLMLIPIDAKGEIEAGMYRDPAEFTKKPTRIRLEGKVWPYVLLLLLTVASIWHIFVETKNRTKMPPNTSVEVSSAELTDSGLHLSVRMNDSSRKYRWFEPNNFRVSFPADPAAGSMSSLDEGSEQQAAEKESEVVGPTRVNVFSDESEDQLSTDTFAPYDGPIRLELYFEVPLETKDRGLFELYYATFGGIGEPLYSGSFNRK